MPASTADLSNWILQEAVSLLAAWSGTASPFQPASHTVIDRAKQLAHWPTAETLQAQQQGSISSLQLVFDRVQLGAARSGLGKPAMAQPPTHYWPAITLTETAATLPYPTETPPDLIPLKAQIASTLSTFTPADWQNANLLLATLEKLGSYISLGGGDISLYDLAKTTSAIALALHNNPQTENLCLIAGDLSGIQTFIYTIASAGALKSLRARSFYLQLVTEEIVYQLLQALSLPRTSIIYAGGGNLYLLAPTGDNTTKTVTTVQAALNSWLLQNFQGKVFLALTAHDFPTSAVADQTFSIQWEAAIKALAKQKQQKFSQQLAALFSAKAAFENCKVCHRDDTEDLKYLNPLDDNSVLACPTCRNLFSLGSKLPKTKAIVRSTHRQLPDSQYVLPFHFSNGQENGETIYYHCFDQAEKSPTHQPTWLINSWELSHYRQAEMRSLLMGDYYARSATPETNNSDVFIRAEELADAATGIKRVGYLRMDVDNLGRIFAKGLGKQQFQIPTYEH